MTIGRWSELSADRVYQEHEVMREANANATSGELGSGGVPVKNTMVRSVIVSAILLPLLLVDPEYQDGLCALKSPRIRMSCVVRRCSIED